MGSYYQRYGIRMQGFYSHYAEIAIENYYEAKQQYAVLKSSNFPSSEIYTSIEIDKKIMITIVFSTMAVESFINDYISVCLGDDQYYENFDRLTILGKLQLIVQFIYKETMNKGTSLYSGLSQLINLRNDFVHNKPNNGYKYIEKHIIVSEVEDEEEPHYEDIIEEPSFDHSELDKDLRNARDSIKTMKWLAEFIDNHDDNADAVSRLLYPVFIKNDMDALDKAKMDVYSEIGLKVIKM